MAGADRLLFAATAANRLVRLDLNNLPVPAPAMAQEAPARIQVAGLEIAGAALVA
jgi:predicted YcjX-like family ATPase